MTHIVQKFGGTSVATIERIKHVAKIIAKSRQDKNVAVVVSAMAGVTNKFVGYVHNLGSLEGDPEYDSVVSSGEIVTAGLLAIILKNMGINSRSYTGWQVPIYTTDNYGFAKIQFVDSVNLEKDLESGVVPIICGFQGINEQNRITTLGRGGSDLTAVAISSAINADLCEIYSDVDGVYTVDPNVYQKAKRLEKVHYCEMLELAAQGAKVLQEQSVDYAMKKNVKIRVASSFIENNGTIICSDASEKKFCGLAITHSLSQFKINHKLDSHEKFVQLLKKHFIRCEILKTTDEKCNILVDKKKSPLLQGILKDSDYVVSAKQELSRRHYSCVSVIGSRLNTLDTEMLISILQDNKIEVFCCSSGDYGINLVVPSDCLLKSIGVLHEGCGLEK